MVAFANLRGQRFGRLMVGDFVGRAPGGHALWRCRCDCGAEVVRRGPSLRNGKVRSCGCLRAEKTKKRRTKHGHNRAGARSKAYRTWAHILSRCDNPNVWNYHHYGGRGITYDPRWRDFDLFLSDMGEPPPGTSIDRIDVNGPYCMSNCRWADAKTQARNRRDSRLITYGGRTATVAEWADDLGLTYKALQTRLRRGWPLDRALAA